MARGIDITQKIDWVVQYDPPSHPASFIHRAGRTARNGDEGQALLLLLPSETDYIDYIKVSQKVKIFYSEKIFSPLQENNETLCLSV